MKNLWNQSEIITVCLYENQYSKVGKLIATICLILNKSCNEISTFLSLKLLKNEKLAEGLCQVSILKALKLLSLQTLLAFKQDFSQ